MKNESKRTRMIGPGFSRLLAGSLLALTVSFGAVTATAVPITGEIHFTGSFSPTGGTGLGDATGLSFNNPVYVASVSGDYTILVPYVDTATIHDFQFNPLLAPVDPLWETTLHGFEFKLESIIIDLQTATQLNLSGYGVLTAPNFDPTPGTWNFQGGGTALFTFRASDGSYTVADNGGSWMLLTAGLGLIVLGGRGFLVRTE